MSFMPHTIEEQAAAMREDWPSFGYRFDVMRDQAVWLGPVTPQNRTYLIEAAYGIDQVLEGPSVRVISPRLTRLPGNAEGSLPHVYNRDRDPILCLFDPAGAQWTGWSLISKTTVPWAIDWLTCYEFWLMTGVWDGGGRHPPASGRHFTAENPS
ncbi:hypothetical protein YA62_011725 [Agrobacterium sp. LC34]|uniref:hypothetical protein n=1 Tax=Agrobacterium sp. LC34 TaxID=1643810 RepID=UPI00069A1228|nr:hypothetical protein [Agrobacterium sp. LC34]TKT60255.1 hypothetical protein YA62_011725 [Agrobacterium sp. LC34]